MTLKGSRNENHNGFQIAQASQFSIQKGEWWRLRMSIRSTNGLNYEGARRKKMRKAALSLPTTLRYEYGNSQSHGDTSQFPCVCA
jgi:hypothetical protein